MFQFAVLIATTTLIRRRNIERRECTMYGNILVGSTEARMLGSYARHIMRDYCIKI